MAKPRRNRHGTQQAGSSMILDLYLGRTFPRQEAGHVASCIYTDSAAEHMGTGHVVACGIWKLPPTCRRHRSIDDLSLQV